MRESIMDKRIIFSKHSKIQMIERGAPETEIVETIKTGEEVPAKLGRKAYRKNFQYDGHWQETFYHIKQVMPIIMEETDAITVITVYTFYF